MQRGTVAILALTAILMSSVYMSGCTVLPNSNCPSGGDCGCRDMASANWGGNLVLSFRGQDLAHKANLTSTTIRVELRAGNVMKYGNLEIVQDLPANGTTPPQIVYMFVFTGPTDTPERMRVSPGSSYGFSVSFSLTGANDPYLATRTFFNGTNNITGSFSIDGHRNWLNLTLDKQVPGVTVKNGAIKDAHSKADLIVSTNEWDFKVQFGTSVLCIG